MLSGMLEVDLWRELVPASVYKSLDFCGDNIQRKRMLGVRKDFSQSPLYGIYSKVPTLENVSSLPMVDEQDQHSDVLLLDMKIPKKTQCCRMERAAEALFEIVCPHT